MIMLVLIQLALVAAVSNSVSGFVTQQSALMAMKENCRLKADHMIQRKCAHSSLSCSQTCLSDPLCASFNYELSSTSRGFCELYRYETEMKLSYEPGWLCGRLLDRQKTVKHFNFTFTNLSAAGQNGPKQTSGYRGTSLEGQVHLKKGFQFWQIPANGSYVIEAWGASGGEGRLEADGSSGIRKGGPGAYMKGTFTLTQGTLLKILVGQKGSTGNTGSPLPGGGGGGTFVALSSNNPLIVAGGGGGGGAPTNNYDVGDPGQSSEEGSQHGGSNGSGGFIVEEGAQWNTFEGGAGGGMTSDGESAKITRGGMSFENGGQGGSSPSGAVGGFGGGGGGNRYPGAGGGFSGGGVFKEKSGKTVAGGGGSYNNGTNSIKREGINDSDGKVVITLIALKP